MWWYNIFWLWYLNGSGTNSSNDEPWGIEHALLHALLSCRRMAMSVTLFDFADKGPKKWQSNMVKWTSVPECPTSDQSSWKICLKENSILCSLRQYMIESLFQQLCFYWMSSPSDNNYYLAFTEHLVHIRQNCDIVQLYSEGSVCVRLFNLIITVWSRYDYYLLYTDKVT